MKAKRIGIVGCGAIGSKIAEAVCSDLKGKALLSALYDEDSDKARKLAGLLKKRNIVVSSLRGLIKKADFVVEASSSLASGGIARGALSAGRDCMIMSVGGLLDARDIFKLAQEKSCFVYVPSGAICGVDGLKAHKLAGIKKITLITRKPPDALKDSPYVIKNKLNLKALKEEREIFDGSAREAVKFFPQNINVAATLSLAGLGREKTRVKIICSPCSKNIHEIEIESGAGKTFIRCENEPSPDNPKTSYLAVLSAIATLRQIFEAVKIGT
jgi:aspartate dehydrogenase